MTILGVPGVINKKSIICKNKKYSKGNILLEIALNKPGAKNGQVGLSKISIS